MQTDSQACRRAQKVDGLHTNRRTSRHTEGGFRQAERVEVSLSVRGAMLEKDASQSGMQESTEGLRSAHKQRDEQANRRRAQTGGEK